MKTLPQGGPPAPRPPRLREASLAWTPGPQWEPVIPMLPVSFIVNVRVPEDNMVCTAPYPARPGPGLQSSQPWTGQSQQSRGWSSAKEVLERMNFPRGTQKASNFSLLVGESLNLPAGRRVHTQEAHPSDGHA